MSKQWRAAVIGTGVVGEWHVRIIPQLPNESLVAVCDIIPDKAEAALAKNKLTGVKVYTDLAEMLKNEKLDVVHVCTPSGNHMDPAITAMRAGVNVITEKPMEIQLDRIDRMIETAKAKNVRLAGIFQNRWNPANRALHDAARAGRFGTLSWAGCFTPWYRTDDYYREGGWRGTWKLDGGGAIMNQSVHAIDLLQWIAGPITQVSAFASSRIHPEIEVEDTLSATVQFESGAFGTIMGSTAMYPGASVRLEIGGGDGHAVSEGGLKTFKFRNELPGDKDLIESQGGKGSKSTGGGSSATDVSSENHYRNIAHILDAWDHGRDADTAGPEARKAVAIITALYESAKAGGSPVRVQ